MKRLPLFLVVTLYLSGCCINPWNTRFPTLWPRSLEYERRESEVQDPFPDRALGPGDTMRPRDFDWQRSEATRAKERNAAAMLRLQNGVPDSPPAPEMGYVYPEAVRP